MAGKPTAPGRKPRKPRPVEALAATLHGSDRNLWWLDKKMYPRSAGPVASNDRAIRAAVPVEALYFCLEGDDQWTPV